MKKSFKERITLLGLSFAKELIILIAINLAIIGATIGLYFYLKEMMVIIIGSIILLTANYAYLSRYSVLEKHRENERVEEFLSLIPYFEAFIATSNNVYVSFTKLLPFCSAFMDDAINSLLSQIDSDKTVGPFITFASKFNNRIIESLMLSIYQMVDSGENSEQFQEFDVLFSSINKEYKDSLVERNKRALDSLNGWPLFGAAAITIVLAISTIGIIGDYINVI